MYPERPACSAPRSLPWGRRAGKGQRGETSCNAPDAKRVHTNNTDTEQTTRTRCAVYATTRNRTPSLVHSYIHTARNKRSVAQQNTARDARVRMIHMSAAQPRGSFLVKGSKPFASLRASSLHPHIRVVELSLCCEQRVL